MYFFFSLSLFVHFICSAAPFEMRNEDINIYARRGADGFALVGGCKQLRPKYILSCSCDQITFEATPASSMCKSQNLFETPNK
jgi:hypothetical protein